MAVKIKFDQTHNVIQPTIVLATRSGKKLGVLPVENIQVSDSMNTYFEFNFVIHKEKDGIQCKLWDQIEDLKLVWCKEWDVWFEIYVEVTEESDVVKNVNAKSLGEAELSQTNLYGVEINTDTDKARTDYNAEHPTIFYRNDPDLKKASLLHRVLEKVPHYTIEYVAESLIKITKVPEFTFDGTSIYDSLQTIAEEYDCLFVINSGTNENGKIARGISAYDLESWCKDPKCGHRDTYFKVCPKCGGKNGYGVDPGYGDDTTIFVSTENLADNITYSTDTDSVKNCFKLEGGDDLMTATIVNCNPNGSGYMWHISDLTKRDMSQEMVNKLKAYDNKYNEIYNGYTPEDNIISENESRTFVFGTDFQINDVFRFVYIENEENKKATVTYDYGMSISVQTLSKDSPISEFKVFTKNVTIQTSENIRVYLLADLQRSISDYNDLANYYNELMKEDYENIPDKIIGYPSLMTAYYNTIDFYLYLKSGLMPNPKMGTTTAEDELAKLNATTLSSVAVQDLDSCSPSSADNAMLGMAKVLVDNRYKTEITSSEYNETSHVWSGKFTVTNYSNKEGDTATHSDVVTVTIREDYEKYVKQKLEKTLNKNQDLIEGANSIVALFDCELIWTEKNGEVTFSGKFADEIKKYGLVSLETFRDSCQACLDILIEMGASDEEKKKDIHDRLYVDYYYKSLALLDEIKVREDEIAIVAKYDKDNNLISGLQYFILQEQSVIHQKLDFEAWMGEYWLDFIAYRREDTYSNENYISDGLNNAELFTRAQEFIEAAKKDIYKSATLQHSITSTLKNLLVMKEFAPIVDYFAVGNWIRIKVDNEIYRLRLLSYTIDFDNLDSLTIEFSDVLKCANGVNDVESILNQAASMASSYSSVKRQANKAEKNNATLNNLVDNGLNVTNTKIMSADNQTQVWDRNGILCRSYDDITESYSDEQLKIINSTLAITNDGWKTIKTAIGKYTYTDPNDHTKEITAYGVIADTIVGKLFIGEKLILSNQSGDLTFDDNGLMVTAQNKKNSVIISPSESSVFSIKDANQKSLLYVDDDGKLVVTGDLVATRLKVDDDTVVEGFTTENIKGLHIVASTGSYTDLKNTPNLDVYLKNADLSLAIDSALAQAKASGEFDGISVTHSWNGTTLTVTSASGTSSSDLKGSKGDTPVKGTDYWTDNDKSEIVNDVIEELRNQGLI